MSVKYFIDVFSDIRSIKQHDAYGHEAGAQVMYQAKHASKSQIRFWQPTASK